MKLSQAIINQLANLAGRGQATEGTKTTLVDSNKVFDADIFNNKILRVNINGIDYYKKITETADSTLTFATLPGTPAIATWNMAEGKTITVTSATDGGNDLTIVAALNAEASQELKAELVGRVLTVTLATGADKASDDAKNTVTLVTAAIDALTEFTAEATGEGSTVVAPTTEAVAFENGIDEVKPIAGSPYEIAWR